MKYEKAKAESISFVGVEIFMTLSTNYPSLDALFAAECSGFNGDSTKFTCNSFAGYGPKPGNGHTFTFGTSHTFKFNTQGNHWYLADENGN